MKATNLQSAIIKMGGTAQITRQTFKNEFGEHLRVNLNGTVNGYDVSMHGEQASFFTVRAISKRGHYDPGSDYNSGDYTFCNRIKDLAYYCAGKVTA
jgi:hypothetical protein